MGDRPTGPRDSSPAALGRDSNNVAMKFLSLILPSKFFYGDHLTSSARRLIWRLSIGVLGLALAGVASGLLNGDNWPDVLAGALFAWSATITAWAVNSYRTTTGQVGSELRRMAELDLLHARLNHISHRLEVPLVDLQSEIEAVLRAREERLAHFAGLDEFRPSGPLAGSDWWDSTALGLRS